MGKKVNPIGFRLLATGWKDSVWFNRKNGINELKIDYSVRKYVDSLIGKCSYSRIVIEQIGKKVSVIIYTHKPGLIIGRKGEEIEKIRIKLNKFLGRPVDVNVQEVNRPEIDARLIGAMIVEKMEARVDYRRSIKFALKSVLKGGAEGCLIIIGGRLGGSSISRVEKHRIGRVPLQRYDAKISLKKIEAKTTFGICGIKVYVCTGSLYGDSR